ncbi:MAG: YqcI/YcgG family protein [Mycobacterium sp.]|nr:YqcI/YcgG family protein [Mycobacterium sp.]
MSTARNATSPIIQAAAALLEDGWRRDAFDDIAERLIDPQFPCIFSRNAFKKGLIRFLFIETIDELCVSRLAQGLSDYVHEARQWDGGLDTAYPLVVILGAVPAATATAVDHHHTAWSILSRLTAYDTEPWPSSLPLDPESPGWSMCFAGMPLFCNISSPAHSLRKSRNLGRYLTIVINPRERFDQFAGDTVSGRNTRRRIRTRVASYDLLPPSPALATYGSGQLEWKQYGLHEDNLVEPDLSGCPFQFWGHATRTIDSCPAG